MNPIVLSVLVCLAVITGCGNRLQDRIDLKSPGGWIDATRFEAELADGAGFTSAVGMPADEFFRDWALLAAAYGAVVASDGLAIARAEMRKLLERPDLPAEQRALVTHQLEEMRIEAPTAPAANQELVRRYRARLDALPSATER